MSNSRLEAFNLQQYLRRSNVGAAKMGFSMCFKFNSIVDVIATLTIQQPFGIMCNKCSHLAFETQFQ
jgi:hypothetical protein